MKLKNLVMLYQFLRKISFLKTISTLLVVVSSVAYSLAQPNQSATQQPELREDYEKEELTLFIQANQQVTSVQKNSEQKIINTIEEGGLDVNTFNKILTAKQQQKKAKDASEDELMKFNNVIDDVIKVQKKMQKKMSQAIKSSGLEVAKYDQIMYAYQNSEKVKQEIDQLIQKNQQK